MAKQTISTFEIRVECIEVIMYIFFQMGKNRKNDNYQFIIF
jgi:hypothetical protein